MNLRRVLPLLIFVGFGAPTISPSSALAVAQWTRKYDVECQTCHTAFPRLNYYGERFMRNGYQMPDSQDGDDTKTKVGDNTYIGKIEDLFSVGANVTPLEVRTHDLEKNGSTTTSVGVGKVNEIQFFAAGTIYKNVSIFAEIDASQDGVELDMATVGWHNIVGPPGVLNVRAGRLSPMKWHVLSDHFQIIPWIETDAISMIQTSGGTNTDTTAGGVELEDQIPVAEPLPSVESYGYYGPVLYAVGVSNGANTDDKNQYKNVFGTLRLDRTEGDFEGSAISAYSMLGWDTANTSTAQVVNRFYRISGGGNLRYEGLDAGAIYILAHDGDWDLSTSGKQKNNQHGIEGRLGYLIDPSWLVACEYDWVSDDSGVDDFNKISPNITWMPRQNVRIRVTPRFDLRNTPGGRVHEILVSLLALF